MTQPPTRPTLLPRTPVKIELSNTPQPAAAPQSSGGGPAFEPALARPLPRAISYNSRPAPTPLWKHAAPWLIAFLVCCCWDRAVWLMVTRNGTPVLDWLKNSITYDHFWPILKNALHLNAHALGDALAAILYAVIYSFGRIYLWLALAVVFIFRHWGGSDGAKVRDGLRRGVFVALVPALAGASAELLKLLVHRARPEYDSGHYALIPWPSASPIDPAFWNWDKLGFISSHAAVAFGGALAVGLLLPRWRAPLYILAALCTISRVAVGAHFLSDALAGIALAFASFHLVYAWDRRNNRGMGLPAHVSGASPEGLVANLPTAHGL